MQTRIRRIVYPRSIGEHDGWISFVPELFDPHAHATAQLSDSYRLRERVGRTSPIYHGIWAEDAAFIWDALPLVEYSAEFSSAFQQLAESFRSRRFPHIRPNRVGAARQQVAPTLGRAAIEQLSGGFRTPDRARLDLRRLWADDLAAVGGTVQPPLVDPSFEPALLELFAAYLSPKRQTRGHDLLWNAQGRGAAAWPEDPRDWVAAFAQQMASFRSTAHRGLDVRRLQWEPEQGWLGLSTFFFWAANAQLANSFLPGRRRGLDPRWLAWWDEDDWIGRQEAQDATAAWAPAFEHLAGGFLPLRRRGLGLLHQAWELFSPEVFDAITVAAQWPALDQLAGSFLVGRRPLFDLRRHGSWLDDLGWALETLPTVESFDPEEYAAIQALLDVYRMGDRRRFDVRTPDVPQEGWRGFVADIELRRWAPAFAQQFSGFRSGARRVWGREFKWEPEFSWLRDELSLPDPSPSVGVYIPTWRPRRFR